MVHEAEANAESDKKRRSDVETRNQAEALVHGAEKAVEDMGSKADPNAKAEVESGVEALRTALEGDDNDVISEKSAALSQAMMKMGEAAYQDNGSSDESNNTSSGMGDGSDETVVDAEFEEVDADEDKKSKS
jgi:molecular chaperone DnaK